MAADRDAKPDLRAGVSVAAMKDGDTLVGRVGDDEVMIVRAAGEIFAVGAHCTHYHGPLSEGLVVGDTVRCPWHHACFNLRTGEAVRAPALDAITCWRVDRQGDTVRVRESLPEKRATMDAATASRAPSSVVIVGGGAAGLAAADMLRRHGYDRPVTIISADDSPPCDRPNLSKDYLAGNAKDDWIPLRPPEYYEERKIELLLRSRVASLDVAGRRVVLENGAARPFDKLLLATGADPVHLTIPGSDTTAVYYLRSFDDSRAIIERAQGSKRAAVVGASFIGLEVAASLRTRGIAVDVVAPESAPLERVMGVEIGKVVRTLHESHGVVFHLGQTVARIDGRTVTLSDGSTLEADCVVVGVGVKPATALAEKAGLSVDHGVVVNDWLETSAPGIFAAGDIARWPDRHSGERIRVEHWVVAERQGQAAARNILGQREPFDAVPFFWSQHYDVTINYVGHAEKWDRIEIDGSIESHDCLVRFKRGDRTLAVATMGRDLQSLQAELELERGSA